MLIYLHDNLEHIKWGISYFGHWANVALPEWMQLIPRMPSFLCSFDVFFHFWLTIKLLAFFLCYGKHCFLQLISIPINPKYIEKHLVGFILECYVVSECLSCQQVKCLECHPIIHTFTESTFANLNQIVDGSFLIFTKGK